MRWTLLVACWLVVTAGCGARTGLGSDIAARDGAVDVADATVDLTLADARVDRTRDLPRRPDIFPFDLGGDAPCVPRIIEAEDAAQVARIGAWNVAHGNVLHAGQGLESSAFQAGETLRWTFRGTGLIVYYESGPSRGAFAVSVDGGVEHVVDSYTPSPFRFQVPSVAASGLPDGVHNARLRDITPVNDDRPVSIDFFRATCD